MKKLLCVLMFGMVFGQAELTTRLYTIATHNNSINNLVEITGYNLEFYILQIIHFDNSYSIARIDDATIMEDGSTIRKVNNTDEIPWYNKEDSHQTLIFSDSFKFLCWGGSGTGNLTFSVTAEFPEEDTGYIDIEDEDFYSIKTGNNLLSSPCRDEIAIEDALPPEIESNLTGIITEGQAATQVDGEWLGSLSHLKGNRGYWFVSNIEEEFNYTCTEN